jgi:hypothetical protein
MSGKSAALLHCCAICEIAFRLGAHPSQNPIVEMTPPRDDGRSLTHCHAPRACRPARQTEKPMNTIAEPNQTTPVATTCPSDAAALPQIKFSPEGFFIDHPDPELGDRLMADALGAVDRDAMHGLLRQLARASLKGQKPDAINLAFMISMVRSIRPRDSIEAMLVAQMVSVHVMAMRCAYYLANSGDVARQDSAARALGKLARIFPAQIDALSRYRNNGEPAITVQNVSVQDGGKAIVGNVTQHASVIVAEKPTRARKRRAKPARPGRPARMEATPEAQA